MERIQTAPGPGDPARGAGMTFTWPEFRRERRRSRQAWALLAAAALAVVAGLGWFFTAGQFAAVEPPADGPREAPVLAAGWMKPVPAVRPVPRGPAAALLDTLPVKGRAGRTTTTAAHLARRGWTWTATAATPATTSCAATCRAPCSSRKNGCVVAAGTLRDPTPAADHLRSGAGSSRRRCRSTTSSHWRTPGRRAPSSGPPDSASILANDPLNLLAADGPANQDKSAGDAATWLPAEQGVPLPRMLPGRSP